MTIKQSKGDSTQLDPNTWGGGGRKTGLNDFSKGKQSWCTS